MRTSPSLIGFLCLIAGARVPAADLPTIESFAARPRIEGVSISPDGRYVALIQTRDKYEVFSRDKHLEPIAISADAPNKAYAVGTFEGRNALWLIDLADQEDPTVVFTHPAADVGRQLLGPDGKMLGIRYETDHPMVYFTDSEAAARYQSL